MAVFFNGRLITTPAVVSRVDDTKMANKNLTVPMNLAIIGRADSGEPKKVYIFQNPVEARERLQGGELLIALLVGALAVLLLAAYLFGSFFKVMDGGLKETRRHLRAMTDGDLTTSPNPWGRDEAAQLMHDLRAMQDSMRAIVTDVRTASDAIVVATTEIAAGVGRPVRERTTGYGRPLSRRAADQGQPARVG